jgi:hypothetical protein
MLATNVWRIDLGGLLKLPVFTRTNVYKQSKTKIIVCEAGKNFALRCACLPADTSPVLCAEGGSQVSLVHVSADM